MLPQNGQGSSSGRWTTNGPAQPKDWITLTLTRFPAVSSFLCRARSSTREIGGTFFRREGSDSSAGHSL